MQTSLIIYLMHFFSEETSKSDQTATFSEMTDFLDVNLVHDFFLSQKIWFYIHSDQTFMPGPNLMIARNWQTTGIITDRVTSNLF